jgi:hypothetical protein
MKKRTQTTRRTTNRLISLFLSAVMLLTTLTVIPTTVFADGNETEIGFSKTFYGDGYEIEYKITGGWGMAPWGVTRVIEVIVHNTGTEDIENWMLAIDDFGGEFNGFWSGATIAYTESGFQYIKNAGFNSVIEPGMSQSFTYPLNDPTAAPGRMAMAQERVTRSLEDFDVSVAVDMEWGVGTV